MSDPTKTEKFNLDLLTRDDPYALSQFNGNMQKIDQELAKPPLTVNEIEPDPETRNIPIKTVPLADNLTSDDAQLNTGTYIVRTSGGEASIANGEANLSSIKGFMEKNGYTPESINVTVNSSTIDVELDRDTFVSYVDQSGTITLTFSSSWSADPSLYGITVNGTPANGDTIVIVYAKENRGIITVASPTSFVSTGWNLYNHTAGYARVVDYSEEYGFMIDGTYTKLEFSETFNGTRQEIVPINGYFVVPADGYLFVTGGNATDTEIWMTWGDWTEEANGGTFEPYSQTAIDLSGLMVSFPDGLMRVGNYADEINFNTQRAISRIEKIDYSESNLETVKGYNVPYETDQNYIYYVKADPDVFTISIDGQYSVSDHGIEMFIGTSVPLTASSLYGQDLKNKLIRGVVQISQQDLTPEQQAQARENIGALAEAVFVDANTVKDIASSAWTWGSDYATGDSPAISFLALGRFRALRLTITPKNSQTTWTTIGTIALEHRPLHYLSTWAVESVTTPDPKHARIKPDGTCEIYRRGTSTYSINFIWFV